jgi:hypothetical protein
VYLLSCLHPNLLITNTLVFSPPLNNLPDTPSPIHLQLFRTIPVIAATPEAYSKHAPIGTGRPKSRILLAESHSKCYDAPAARRGLVKNLLGGSDFVAYMFDKYNVLATLYSSETDTLLSLKRGMIEMLGTGENEWYERVQQLWGEVDESCTLDAQMEIFLLGVGRDEVEEWVRTVEGTMNMERGERESWARAYADAAAFLGRASSEAFGV